MDNNNCTIENQQIKGVTAKLFATLIIGTASIVATVVGSYYGIITRFDQVNSANSIQDLQIKVIQVQVDRLQTEVDKLKDNGRRNNND